MIRSGWSWPSRRSAPRSSCSGAGCRAAPAVERAAPVRTRLATLASTLRIQSMTRGAEPPTDEELVVAVLAGDRDRFGVLVDRYQGRLVSYLFRLLRNVDDAHDLAQE